MDHSEVPLMQTVNGPRDEQLSLEKGIISFPCRVSLGHISLRDMLPSTQSHHYSDASFQFGDKKVQTSNTRNGEEVMSDKQMKGQTNYGNLPGLSPRTFFFGCFFFSLKIMNYACSDSSVVKSERECRRFPKQGSITPF